MQIIRNAGSALGQRLVFDEAEFDAIAIQALRDSGCLPSEPRPVRIDRFIEKQFGLTLGYEDMGLGVLGATAFAKNGRVCGMAVSPALAEDTAINLFRSTAAHEAGHGLLHPILFMEDIAQTQFRIENADVKKRRILCRESDIKPGQGRKYDGRWWEYQANRMIGSLLLPAALVKIAVKPFLSTTAVTGSPVLPEVRRKSAADEVADIFNVSSSVAAIRLAEIFPACGGQQEF